MADSRIDMTTGPITPRLFRLALPLVLGNILQTLYNLADLFWVGRVSQEAVSAVSLMFPLTYLFVSSGLGLSSATIALVSQNVGSGQDREADRIVAQTTILAVAASLVLAALGLVFRHWILWMMGARGQVFTESLAYIEVIFLTLPLTFLFFAFRASLQGAGDTKTAMWIVAVSALLNIVIDPVFVLDWGPFLGWGTYGAAVATFIARLVAALVGIAILVNGSWGVKLWLRDLEPNPRILRQLIDVGYPSTLDGWARSFAAVVMAAFVARFGAAAVAAYGIGVRLMSITWTVSGAVGQATATGVGQNLGAGTPDRAKEVAYKATVATMGVLFAAGALAWLFPAFAIRVIIPTADAGSAVVEEGVRFLRIIALSWAFFGGLMVLQGGFRGAGSTRIALVLSMLSRWVFRVPTALLLAFGAVSWSFGGGSLGPISIPGYEVGYTGLAWGVDGLWWAYASSAVASFLVGLLWFARGTWMEAVVVTDAPAEQSDTVGEYADSMSSSEHDSGGFSDSPGPASGPEDDPEVDD